MIDWIRQNKLIAVAIAAIGVVVVWVLVRNNNAKPADAATPWTPNTDYEGGTTWIWANPTVGSPVASTPPQPMPPTPAGQSTGGTPVSFTGAYSAAPVGVATPNARVVGLSAPALNLTPIVARQPAPVGQTIGNAIAQATRTAATTPRVSVTTAPPRPVGTTIGTAIARAIAPFRAPPAPAPAPAPMPISGQARTGMR